MDDALLSLILELRVTDDLTLREIVGEEPPESTEIHDASPLLEIWHRKYFDANLIPISDPQRRAQVDQARAIILFLTARDGRPLWHVRWEGITQFLYDPADHEAVFF